MRKVICLKYGLSLLKLVANITKDIPGLVITNDATQVAELLLARHAVPVGSEEDALHIGIAAAQSVDYLLTWNFKHINNAEKKIVIADVVASYGFICPQLCSPEELGGAFND